MFRKILITFILVIIMAFLFWSSFSLQNIFYEIVFFIENYTYQNQILAIIIFIILAALSAMLSPFSSIPFVSAGIIIWGNFMTISFLLIGWMIGAIVAYSIGYFSGYPLVNQFYFPEKIKYYKERISDKTGFLMVLFFRFAIPAEITGYALGIIRYHFGKYFLATFIAELPFAIIAGYASDALVAKKPVIFISLVTLAFLFIGLIFYLFNRKLKSSVKI